MVPHSLYPTVTHYLNVDLDLKSREDLQPLVTALGRKAAVLYVGRVGQTWRAHLELARFTRTPDAAIRGFCALIDALPNPARQRWNQAKVRDFNIGVQAGTQPHASEFAVATETLRAVARLGARIVLTVYASEQSSAPSGVSAAPAPEISAKPRRSKITLRRSGRI